jgi:hypothetical protein
MKPLRQINKRYRQLLIASLIASGSMLPLLPALADPTSPTGGQNSAAPGVIENQATAEFTDSADGSTLQIVSDKVQVTVAEIAGISAAASGTLPINNGAATPAAPTLYPTSTVYFDFIVKNEGNDPTKLFIPGVPSVATVNGTAVTPGQLTIVSYSTATPGTGTTTTPPTFTTAAAVNTPVVVATGAATDSVPAGGYVTVRVPITIPFGTPRGADINVTLGNTTGSPSTSNTPYIASGNDLVTQDNTGTANGDTDGAPFNGDAPGHRQEASASQTVKVIVPTVVVSGKVYDDANNTAQDSFANGIQDGTESGAVVTPAPVYAVLVNSSNQVIASTQVINNGTTGTNGNYTFTGVDGYQNGLYVILSSTSLAANTLVTPASQTLPAGWTATTPLIYPAFDITNADTAALVTSYTLKDFGIELLPTAVGATATSQVNPVGINLFTVPATVFTSSTDLDPNGTGGVKAYTITAFPSNTVTLIVNGTSYTTANFPVGGVTFTPAQLNAGAVQVDPIDGESTVNIPFRAIDTADKLSTNTANGLLPFTAAAVTISGTVYNDKDKSAIGFTNIKPNTAAGVDDIGTDTLSGTNGTPIYATLYNTATNKVIATQLIPNTGIYSFSNVSATTNVNVLLSTAQGVVGSAAPAAGLPDGWVGTTLKDSGSFNTGNYGTNVAIGGFAEKDFGVIQKAKLVIVKRITKIGKTLATMSDTNPNDSTPLNLTSSDSFNFNATKNPSVPNYVGNWPVGYIVGAVDAGKVRPGDFIEYTIYFLNNQGADAKNIRICDPIRGSQDYVPSSVSIDLTNNPATAGNPVTDASRLSIFTNDNIPANCNIGSATSTGAHNGGVAIDITGTTAATDRPVSIPGATAPGTPNTYGMFRFRTQVKP